MINDPKNGKKINNDNIGIFVKVYTREKK